jgi:hypothetical protein
MTNPTLNLAALERPVIVRRSVCWSRGRRLVSRSRRSVPNTRAGIDTRANPAGNGHAVHSLTLIKQRYKPM